MFADVSVAANDVPNRKASSWKAVDMIMCWLVTVIVCVRGAMIDERGSMAGQRLAKKKRRNFKKNLLHCHLVQPTEHGTEGPVAVSVQPLAPCQGPVWPGNTARYFTTVLYVKFHNERWSKYASFRTFSVGIAQAIVSKGYYTVQDL